MRQYILVHEQGWTSGECGAWVELCMVEIKDNFAAKAREARLPAFSIGEDLAAGACHGEHVHIARNTSMSSKKIKRILHLHVGKNKGKL